MIAEFWNGSYYWLQVLIIALLAAAYFADRIGQGLGLAPSQKLLRAENEDLIRRNKELEETVLRHESEIQILRAQIADLKATDQRAVIELLREHEVRAAERGEQIVNAIDRLGHAIRGGSGGGS